MITVPSAPSMTTRASAPASARRPGPGSTAGRPGARPTIAGWALAAAEHGRETADALWIDQRHIGRRQLVGEDDGTCRHRRIGDVGLLDQIADEPRADDADVLDARRQVGVAHAGKALGNLVDLELHGSLGVDPRARDTPFEAADAA